MSQPRKQRLPWFELALVAGFVVLFVAIGAWYIGLAIVVIGALMAGYGHWGKKTWGDVTLVCARSEFMMGERVFAELRTVGGQTPDDYTISAFLIGRELARYGSGTERVSSDRRVHEAACTVTDRTSGTGVVADLEAIIPPSGPPTMKLGDNNTVEWFIQVKLGAPGVPDTLAGLHLQVRPLVTADPPTP